MATYKFYYLINGNNNIQQKEYVSSYNINQVMPYFLNDTSNVLKVERIDIIADPDNINTNEALGYK